MVFEREEYRERIRRAKERMSQEGLEVLVATHPANMNYLTGYDGWSFYVHQGALLFIDEEEPIWFGRQMDSNGARLTSWLKEESIRGYEDDYVQSLLKHPMSFAADIVKEKKREASIIGVEMDNYYFTPKCLEVLKEDLPQARFKDANLLVPMVRQIKSPQEIEYIRQAGGIVTLTMERAIDTIQVGVKEAAVAAMVYHTQILGTPKYPGDYTAIAPLIPSAERTSTSHLSWVDREYKKGDVIFMELAGCRYKYNCPLSRTVFIGDPPDDLQEVAKVVVHGVNETLDCIKPGVTCEEVEAKWREAISGSRVVKESRLGYPFGLSYPPDWGEHTASLRPGDKTILKPNMTFHLMPGIWLDAFGFENSEPFVVTEDGCKTFVDFPRKLFIK